VDDRDLVPGHSLRHQLRQQRVHHPRGELGGHQDALAVRGGSADHDMVDAVARHQQRAHLAHLVARCVDLHREHSHGMASIRVEQGGRTPGARLFNGLDRPREHDADG
jgi:hypothetical protein